MSGNTPEIRNVTRVGAPRIRTWRERIGATSDFPLHVPSEVERAMEAEIAELRASWRASGPLNGIPATFRHDEGAIARCSYCGRYTLDRKALSDRQPVCECGKQQGWSGSFVKPGPDAMWSGKAPLQVEPAPLELPALDVQTGEAMTVPRRLLERALRVISCAAITQIGDGEATWEDLGKALAQRIEATPVANAELYIGVAAGMEHAGATITVIERRDNVAIVHYSGTHPAGETMARLYLDGTPVAQAASVPRDKKGGAA